MYALATINPFLATRFKRVSRPLLPQTEPQPERCPEAEQLVYARLPQAPKNASPVPHLTSLYHNQEAGPYGDRGYPVIATATSSRTCCVTSNLSASLTLVPAPAPAVMSARIEHLLLVERPARGRDACDASQFPRGCFDFAWIHPPYWRQKLYSQDARCLSRAPTLDAFLERLPATNRQLRRGTQTRRQAGRI